MNVKREGPDLLEGTEVPVRLAIVALSGSPVAYNSSVVWEAGGTNTMGDSISPIEVVVNPQDSREAVVKARGPGTGAITVTTSVLVDGKEVPVNLVCNVRVTRQYSNPEVLDVSLEWGQPRPISEEPQAWSPPAATPAPEPLPSDPSKLSAGGSTDPQVVS